MANDYRWVACGTDFIEGLGEKDAVIPLLLVMRDEMITGLDG